MMTVLFLSGITRGGALEGISRSYAPALRNLGLELVEVSLASLDPLLHMLRSGALQKVSFVLSCVGMGQDLTTTVNGQETSLWQHLGIPFITLHGDSPAYFFDRHIVRSNNFISLYAFAEHRDLRARLPRRHGPIGTLPPILLDELPLADLDLKAKRSSTLLFLKNGKNPADIRELWSEIFDPFTLTCLHELASELEANLDAPASTQIDGVVTRYLEDRGFDAPQLIKLRLLLIAQLDDYLRAVKCTRMVTALLDLPIQIRGNNWHHVDFSGRRATYIDDCNYVDSITLIRQSLGLIDMSPNTASLPHDRVMRAYGSHTLCLTNATQSFLSPLPHQDHLTFTLETESLQQTAAALLANPARAVEMGISVAEAFRRLNPPENAFRKMQNYAALTRLDQAPTRLPGLQDFVVWPPQVP